MNIFQFLGLPSDFRSEDKVTHKVKNQHEVNEAKQKWPAMLQVKEDGVHALVVIHNGEVRIFSRTGREFTNLDLICRELASSLPVYVGGSEGVVLSCELVNELLSLEELSGMTNPNRVNDLDVQDLLKIEQSKLIMFDFFSVSEFVSGESTFKYIERFARGSGFIGSVFSYKLITPVLCKQVNSMEEVEQMADIHIKLGCEGIVLKQSDFIWQAGKKDHCMTKIVRGVDFDLEIVGIETGKAGTKREGQVTNLLVRWRPYGDVNAEAETLPVDGRYNDTLRKAWHDNPSLVIGKILHVHALQMGSKGSLRLAKGREVRVDKFVADL